MAAMLKWLAQRPDAIERMAARNICTKLLGFGLFMLVLLIVGSTTHWSSPHMIGLVRIGFFGVIWLASYVFFRWLGLSRLLAGLLTVGIALTTFIY